MKFTVTAVGKTSGTSAVAVFTDGPGLTLAATNPLSASPTRNALTASRSTAVSVTFDSPMDATASAGALKVFSQQAGGLKAGTTAASGSTLTFTPNTPFQPGETVLTTVTTAAQSTNNKNLSAPHTYQFTTAAAVAPGVFAAPATAANGTVSVGTSPSSVAVGDVDGDGDLDLLTANYNGSSNSVSVRLNQGGAVAPTITFGPLSETYGDAAFPLAPTSNSSGNFTYSLVSGTGATVTAAGLITITGAGSVVIKVVQAASGSYLAGEQTATLTIAKAQPVFSNLTSPASQYGAPATAQCCTSTRPRGG